MAVQPVWAGRDGLAHVGCAWVNSFGIIKIYWRLGSMSSAPTQVNETKQQSEARHARRNVWIMTGYGITGLLMLGVMFYSLAQYAAH